MSMKLTPLAPRMTSAPPGARGRHRELLELHRFGAAVLVDADRLHGWHGLVSSLSGCWPVRLRCDTPTVKVSGGRAVKEGPGLLPMSSVQPATLCQKRPPCIEPLTPAFSRTRSKGRHY